MDNSKILYITRPDFYNIFGGDTVQVTKIKEYILNKHNICIDIITIDNYSNEENFLDYDIYHFWGIAADLNILEIIKLLKQHNKKVVVNTIYWNLTHTFFLNFFIAKFLNYKTNLLLEKLCLFFNLFVILPVAYIMPKYRKKIQNVYGSRKFKSVKKETIKLSDSIIPNSIEEGELLCNDISLKYHKVKEKFTSIPNAVDINYIEKHKDTGFMSDVKDFILEAAGIEPLKNQLGILCSLYDRPDIPIILAGGIRDKRYYKKLKEIAEKRGNVYFTEKIPPEDLFSLYKRAKVHALPSFRESPGLSTLEALICGSQIVVSNEKYCPIKYYQFDKYGFVCNPYDVNSIRNAILEAYSNPKNISLSEDYINFFSYENSGKMTYKIYEKLLNMENTNGSNILK